MFSDEIHLAQQKSRADAFFYEAKQKAAANNELLTKEYLELKKYESLGANSKIYFGESIPQMFVNGGAGLSKCLIDEVADNKV